MGLKPTIKKPEEANILLLNVSEESGDWRPGRERDQAVSVPARLDSSPLRKMNFSSENRTEDFEIFEISDTINVLAYAIMAVGKILDS